MTKAAEIGRSSTKGSFHLLWGLVVSTLISSVATILVARLLGSDAYGLYGIVLIGPTMIGVFRDWGINSAVTRNCAQYRQEGRINEIRSIVISGFAIEIVVGLSLSVLSFVLSSYLASNIFNRPAIVPLIQVASISILTTGLVNAATAVFTGLERLEYNSVMLIIQSIFKTLIMIVLVLAGLGTSGAVIGFTAAFVIAATTGGMLVYRLYVKLPQPNSSLEIRAYSKNMLKYGIPISLANIISKFIAQFYLFLLPIFYLADNTAIGNYSLAVTFIVLITFFATPITIMLFPAFSKLNPEKDKEALKNVFQFSIKYASLLVIPLAALVMSLANPAINMLFGNSYLSAPLFLSLLAITYFDTALGSLTMGNFILSQGKTTYNLYLNIFIAAVAFPIGYFLIMHLGVIGLIISTLSMNYLRHIINIVWTKKNYGLTVDWRSSIKILGSSLITSALTYLLVSTINLPSWMLLIIGTSFFAIIFLGIVLLTKTIDTNDMRNLKSMTYELGLLRRLIVPILNIIEKIMHALKL